jgi:hypothetical protein
MQAQALTCNDWQPSRVNASLTVDHSTLEEALKNDWVNRCPPQGLRKGCGSFMTESGLKAPQHAMYIILLVDRVLHCPGALGGCYSSGQQGSATVVVVPFLVLVLPQSLRDLFHKVDMTTSLLLLTRLDLLLSGKLESNEAAKLAACAEFALDLGYLLWSKDEKLNLDREGVLLVRLMRWLEGSILRSAAETVEADYGQGLSCRKSDPESSAARCHSMTHCTVYRTRGSTRARQESELWRGR